MPSCGKINKFYFIKVRNPSINLLNPTSNDIKYKKVT